MKKIGVITFHASHNYGSCLQAYALQEFIKNNFANEVQYNIINFRSIKQKDKYKNLWNKKGFNNFLKKIVFFNKRKELIKKDFLFEDFINNKLQVTKEYNNLNSIDSDILKYDYYISGSDQIWNLKAFDFDWNYYLEFVNNGKKISYAASFGDKNLDLNDDEIKRISKDVRSYNSLSVREKGSYDLINKITGLKPQIHIDPTMLLEKKEWKKIINPKRIVKNKYIFFYNLKRNKKNIMMVKKIGKILKMPVVISKCSNQYEMFGFKKKFDIGPLEFLNLIENADLVISSSFHGTVFSILLNKPFYAIDGEKDYRISTLLKKTNLLERTINIYNFKDRVINKSKISFDDVDLILDQERKKSLDYLKRSLDI